MIFTKYVKLSERKKEEQKRKEEEQKRKEEEEKRRIEEVAALPASSINNNYEEDIKEIQRSMDRMKRLQYRYLIYILLIVVSGLLALWIAK